MPNSTRIRRAIRTIAWPLCSRACDVLVRVFGTVNGICSDDDLVANNLLDDRSQRLEVEPEGHLDRLVADGRSYGVAPRPGRGQSAEAATRTVGDAVARSAWVGDEDPARVRGRQRRRAGRNATVGDGAVGARVGEDLGHGVRLDCGCHVG